MLSEYIIYCDKFSMNGKSNLIPICLKMYRYKSKKTTIKFISIFVAFISVCWN